MQMSPEDLAKRLKPPVFELPKFEFETFTIDLQNIFSGDAQKDGREAESLVENFLAIQRQKAKVKRKLIVAFYPNLHPNIKICFLTLVLLDADKVQVKRRPFTVMVPPSEGDKTNDASAAVEDRGSREESS